MNNTDRIKKLNNELKDVFVKGYFDIIREIKLFSLNKKQYDFLTHLMHIELKYNKESLKLYVNNGKKMSFLVPKIFFEKYSQSLGNKSFEYKKLDSLFISDITGKYEQLIDYVELSYISFKLILDNFYFLNEETDIILKKNPYVKYIKNYLEELFLTPFSLNPIISKNKEYSFSAMLYFKNLGYHLKFYWVLPENMRGEVTKKGISSSSYNRSWIEALFVDLTKMSSMNFYLTLDEDNKMKYYPKFYEMQEDKKEIELEATKMAVTTPKKIRYEYFYEEDKLKENLDCYIESVKKKGLIPHILYENLEKIDENKHVEINNLKKINKLVLDISSKEFLDNPIWNNNIHENLKFLSKRIEVNKETLLELENNYKDLVVFFNNLKETNKNNNLLILCENNINKAKKFIMMFNDKYNEQIEYYLNLTQLCIDIRLDNSIYSIKKKKTSLNEINNLEISLEDHYERVLRLEEKNKEMNTPNLRIKMRRRPPK